MNQPGIWIVSELFYPDESATGYILTRIAEGLAETHSVNVICGYPRSGGSGPDSPPFEVNHNVAIHRCRSVSYDPRSLLLRSLNVTMLSISMFLKVISKVRRGDCIIFVTNPPMQPFFMALASRLKRAKSVLLIHDLFPEALDATNLTAPGSLVIHLFNAFNSFVYKTCTRIIVLGRDMRRRVVKKLPDGDRRLALITNWAETDRISPSPRQQNALLNELNLLDKFVVQYIGTMGYSHGIEGLLECAKNLQTRPDIHFLFIGSGIKKQWLEERIADLKLANITLLPHQDRRTHDVVYNACDIGIISMVKGMSGVSVPSRMYNIMSAGKPIVAVTDDDSELAMVVREENIGWVIDPGRPDRIEEAICAAKAGADTLVDLGRRARNAAEKKYTFTHVMRAYNELIESISSHETAA